MKYVLAVICVLLITPAFAQEKAPPTTRSFILALQQMGAASEVLIQDQTQRIATLQARVVELEKLCGDPCKGKTE